ncbi:MAG TPA: pyridoxal phosphate-dependent aminotransferase, partial [Acidobacteriaceae bacterium]|nr:pyridoxal phosphate-dependent aminotransferase [Acidobacteriaceae bacterium]
MSPKFSARTQWDLQETPYAVALRRARADVQPIFDLTASNPTTCSFVYDEGCLLGLLRQPEALLYEPDPRGLRRAREAIASYYQRETGADLDPDHLLLTTSTSEAYSFLFRLLCDPGEEILIPQPSYPLFEFLADLEDVRLTPYPLFYDHGWHLDVAAMEARITSRTRAIMVVQPNNPTGHFTKSVEREALERVCEQHDLALIIDEVFLDYALDSSGNTLRKSRSFTTSNHPVLTFVLSGLSKVAALPQMKVAWVVCLGPQDILKQATARLEIIADTFLSMNAPIQHALPGMLAARWDIQQQIVARVRGNLADLDRQLAQQRMVSRLVVEAGWYVVLRIPALGSADAAAIRLLE